MSSMSYWFNSKENPMAASMETENPSGVQCSKRVNVPLIGTKGCINYNHVLA